MKKNLSLQKKSSARVAAVQCIYQAVVMDESPKAERLIAQFTDRQLETLQFNDEELKLDADPDLGYFRELVEGVSEQFAGLQAELDRYVSESWSKERMSPLLVAILLVALFELKHRPSPPVRVIVDEYVTIAGGFFSEAEQGFVNALLDKAGRTLRPDA